VQTSPLTELIQRVSGITGISLTASSRKGKRIEDFEFRISGLEEPNGVSLKIFRTPRGVAGVTHFDLFSRDLVKRAELNYRENRDEVIALLSSEQLTVLVNHSALSDVVAETAWSNLELRWFIAENEDEKEWGVAEELLTAAIPTLFDLLTEFEVNTESQPVGKTEGAVTVATCGNRKRSATNRTACLRHFGAVCNACGLKPEDLYGAEGPSIMHVHHLTPLSAMESPRALSPIDELVPLCPNCHNFAHKRNPPFSPEEIRDQISS